MNIEYDLLVDGTWVAIDTDRYDGAEDGDMTCGIGTSKIAALMELCDNYGDQETPELWKYFAEAYALGLSSQKEAVDKLLDKALRIAHG